MPAHGYGPYDLITSREELRRWRGCSRERLKHLLAEYPEIDRRLSARQGVLVSDLARVLGLTLQGEGETPRRQRRGLPKMRAS